MLSEVSKNFVQLHFGILRLKPHRNLKRGVQKKVLPVPQYLLLMLLPLKLSISRNIKENVKVAVALEISGRFGQGFHSIRITLLLFRSKARTAWIPMQKR